MLAGVVLTQLAAPGTPVYYGPRLSAVDPRSGVVVSGTPETGVASVAAVLLARRYGLACDCYGPCSDSKVVDAQFGYERAVNALLGMAARPRLLSGIGEIQAGVSSCLEVLVIDDEVLNNVFYAVAGRPWDADALDVEAMVDGVLSGRGFLGTKHTRRYIRSEFVTPLLSYRGGLSEWLAAGRRRRRGPGRREGRPLSWSASRWGCPTTCSRSCAASSRAAPPRPACRSTPSLAACSGCRLAAGGAAQAPGPASPRGD